MVSNMGEFITYQDDVEAVTKTRKLLEDLLSSLPEAEKEKILEAVDEYVISKNNVAEWDRRDDY
jgi:hypothetical protein